MTLEATLESTKLGALTLSGRVDFLLSAREQIPRSPFFCLHEYKKEKGSEGDPLGQLLIAMCTAQQLNQEAHRSLPVYGAYVQGRNWYFVVLDQQTYAVSDAYIASREDIYQIFGILKKLKEIIPSS